MSLSTSPRAINLLAVFLIILYSHSAQSTFWEYAVTINDHIAFFNKNWSRVAESMHHLSGVVSAAYNEVDDILYFNDKYHPEVSIFALKPESGNGKSEAAILLNKTDEESIRAMTYDFVEETLYWTDNFAKKIFKLDMRIKDPKREVFMELKDRPVALALDLCDRSLYFSINDAPNTRIMKASIKSPSDAKLIFKDGLEQPNGLTVDLANGRLYWINNKDNQKLSVESVNLEGAANHSQHLNKKYHDAKGVLVDQDYIYWTDKDTKSVHRIRKGIDNDTVTNVAFFEYTPEVILSRKNNLLLQAESQKCGTTVEAYKLRVKLGEEKRDLLEKVAKLNCMNGGKKNSTTAKCDCSGAFEGENCEVDRCHNFCLNNGVCTFSSLLKTPVCKCTGFSGSRCESVLVLGSKACNSINQSVQKNVCQNFCLNNGRCTSSSSSPPTCKCPSAFTGTRCETEICPANYCLNAGNCTVVDNKPKCECPTKYLGDRCENRDIEACPIIKCPGALNIPTCNCSNVEEMLDDNGHAYRSPVISSCKKHTTYIILSVCITLSLLILLAIVVIIKRVYKPLRPRIKKKYVVHKSLEPLTSRPTTESCEVIIEDCCNMNICETPCFDPKMLQQAMDEQDEPALIGNGIKPKKCKDDKRELLADMF